MRIISGSRKALRVGIINKFLKVDNYFKNHIRLSNIQN